MTERRREECNMPPNVDMLVWIMLSNQASAEVTVLRGKAYCPLTILPRWIRKE
jgi:hypothetical protein